jgi:hypothetical protein
MKDTLRHVWILVRLRWKLVFAAFAGKWAKKAAAVLGFLLIAVWGTILGSTPRGCSTPRSGPAAFSRRCSRRR